MVSAIGGLFFNTMPLLLGSAGEASNMSAGQLGKLSITAGAGYLLGTLTGPFWVDRVNWRMAAFAIVAAAIAAFLAVSQLSGLQLFIGFPIFGFICALAIALAMRVLADMPDPEHAYGTRLSVELVSIGVFLIFLPIIFIAKAGFSGAMYGLACMAALLGLGCFLFPKKTSVKAAADTTGFPSWEKARHSWAVLGIFALYLLLNVGLFYFLYVIAQGFNPTNAQNGLMFGVLKWLGGAAGALGAIIGARAGVKLPHFIALAILLIGVLGLFLAQTFTQFMVASWVWEFGFTLGCLYQTAAIVRYDMSNKLVVLVPMAFGLSMMFGGGIAGGLIEADLTPVLYTLVAFCAAIPALYIYLARPSEPFAELAS